MQAFKRSAGYALLAVLLGSLLSGCNSNNDADDSLDAASTLPAVDASAQQRSSVAPITPPPAQTQQRQSSRRVDSIRTREGREPVVYSERPDDGRIPGLRQVSSEQVVVPRGDQSVAFLGIPLRVTKLNGDGLLAGEEFTYQLQIEALDDVRNVKLREELSPRVRFESSSPPPTDTLGGEPFWIFPTMSKGEQRTILVRVVPEDEGAFDAKTVFSAETPLVLAFYAGAPTIGLEKRGPSSVELGEEVAWDITVANTGTAPARNLTITDRLPPIFDPTSTTTITIPELYPGVTKTFRVTGVARRTGSFVNEVVASWEGGPDGGLATTSQKVPGEVKQSLIGVAIEGPAETFVLKPARYGYTVTNSGETVLRNVTVVNDLPDGIRVVEAGGGIYSEPQRRILWNIPSLRPGESRLFNARFFATRPGSTTNTISAETEGRDLSDKASTVTLWKPVPAVRIEIDDTRDPVQVGGQTTYVVRVSNQGNFQPVNADLEVTFTQNIQPISFVGEGSQGGQINGQVVTFPQVPLEPGQDLRLEITARGVTPGQGDAVLELRADFLSRPYVSEEPTNVF
ncbi:MAG: CARDB domain-containing protein [Opitutales bacterium]